MSDSPQDEFYSSELVAATYKLLGLINDSLPSNKYQIGISCTNKIFRPVFYQGKYHGQIETQHIAWWRESHNIYSGEQFAWPEAWDQKGYDKKAIQ